MGSVMEYNTAENILSNIDLRLGQNVILKSNQ